MLPATENNDAFQTLRKKILTGIIQAPRKHHAHITLMHPRNSTCTYEIFREVKNYIFPNKIIFNKISIIEQEIGKPWEIIKEFYLKSTC